MRVEHTRVILSMVLLALIALATVGIIVSNITALAGGLDEAFNIVGESLRLKYEYTYSVEVSNIGGASVTLNVSEYYMYVITNLNSTHVKVISSPVGNVTVKFVSGSWVALAALLGWAGSNVTMFIKKFIIPSIDNAVVPKSKLQDVLKAVAAVSPVRLEVPSKSCNLINMDKVLFNARRYDVGVSGEAYYECKTGILLKYVNGTASVMNLGSRNVKVRVTLYVKLVAANTELLKEVVVGHVPSASTTLPAKTSSIPGWVPYALLTLSIALAVAMGIMYFKIRRAYQK